MNSLLFKSKKRLFLLNILKKEQTNSNFKSYASFSKKNSKKGFITKTNFIPSLVLFSISHSKLFDKEIQRLQRKTTRFLIRKKSTQGTFNYFVDKTKYADDIDDTALAYIALNSSDVKLFSIYKDTPKFVQALIKCEIKEGGPYTTWLNSNYPIEVDLAVNINIMRALQIHDIYLPSLLLLVKNHIKNNNFKSRYYISPLFTIYFLSFVKNLPDSLKKKVINYILSLRQDKLWNNLLESALAINSLINLAAPYELTINAIKMLDVFLHKHEITNDPICLDPAVNGKQMYCRSKAVSVALLLEINNFRHNYILKRFEELISKLNINIEGLTKCLIHEFTDLPFNFHDSLKQKVLNEEALVNFTSAYLLGIVAYDIFDDIYDDAKNINYLPTALTLLTQMGKIFEEQGFNRETIDLFIFETNKGIMEEKLKKKDNLYSGRKSIGFALPCFLLISRIGINKNHKDWKNLYQFFLHFLTARALHDDMTDYSSDLKAKRPNSVINILKRNKSNIHKKVNLKISNHTKNAKKYLRKVELFENNDYLYNLLRKLSI